jgi:uncharacterized lipoprotein YbaY
MKPRRSAPAIALSLAALLAGCGGETASTPATTDATATPAPAAAPEASAPRGKTKSAQPAALPPPGYVD